VRVASRAETDWASDTVASEDVRKSGEIGCALDCLSLWAMLWFLEYDSCAEARIAELEARVRGMERP